ncbi:hypothetical protein TWF481_001928 [Arthrobotrys musiformis]|uniref:Uncharacterized protein n=1 Tax=Arthrobotrys musiformis TaxID=47236 RepID=A0AAV9VUP1_9PEZI
MPPSAAPDFASGDGKRLIQIIRDIITKIGNNFKLDALGVSQLSLQPGRTYMPVIQPFEDITFRGPTIGPANSVDVRDVDIWKLPEQTCRMDINWVFRGQDTSGGWVRWQDTINIKWFTNHGDPDGPIVEIPLSPTNQPRTECSGDNNYRCLSTPENLLTMQASPQHFNRNSRDEYTFNRDYIQFYYGNPGDAGFISFHTDTNGHAEDNYLIPARFPSCTKPTEDPSDKYFRDWDALRNGPYGTTESYAHWTVHRLFTITEPDGGVTKWYDGDV